MNTLPAAETKKHGSGRKTPCELRVAVAEIRIKAVLNGNAYISSKVIEVLDR
jgi:hypothetical protein